jgi:hypothetical protein
MLIEKTLRMSRISPQSASAASTRRKIAKIAKPTIETSG